ncbi:MAG: lactate racemase domain-containing protein [Desulfopila sp.]
MAELFLRSRSGKTYFSLPDDWNLLTFAAFTDREQPHDPIGMARKSLQAPVGHEPLAKVVKPDQTIAIIIEDPSRNSPKQQVLRAVLAECEAAGLPKSQVVIVIGLGTHRQLERAEMEAVYGADLVEQYEFINHDCHAADLVAVGKLRSGTVVAVNRRVHEADFVIGIGSIFPHPMNGFGGGGKILFPAVANFEAILEHHLAYAFRGGSRLGCLGGNPFYQEVTELALAGGLDFIVNSVLDHNDFLYEVVCGAPAEAHLAGVETSRRILSMQFAERADVTLISAFPYSEGTQIMKPLAPASEITREGGIVILVADCNVPLPPAYLTGCERFRRANPGKLRPAVLDLFAANCRILEDGAPEFNMSMAQALLGQNDYTIILVTRDIGQQAVEQLGFLYAASLEQALAMAREKCPVATAHVVPSGGVILPVLAETKAPAAGRLL